ncbi:hypothetical protein ARMGADRAFT_1087175 [Armillaria gallica]|uniref:Mid2 domain-containing protein n=1 Tax=Armillaria gallica TaxID=47427 RepID=A0A2H3CS85_ARMGA|nr:hypothetical protein ARMGADRAFT_1087175 [Armillaria gallica]
MELYRHETESVIVYTIVSRTIESPDSNHVQATSISTVSSDSESSLSINPSDSDSISTRESAVSSAGTTSASTTRHSQASSTKVIANATTSSSPSETSSYTSHSHQPQHTPTIIGAVLGPIVLFLLLALAAFLLRRLRLRKAQSSAKLSPNPGLMHSSQSEDLPAKSRRRLTVPSDGNSVEHPESVSGGGVVQEGDQIPPEEDIPHAGTSSSPRAMDDEAVAEILRLSNQIQQLLTERASAQHPDREPDAPPAYVEGGTEDLSR